MKAQELKTKTSAQTLIYKIFLQRYQVYQGRLLASFQDDAKYEHVGQDTRSQGGKDDQDKQGKDLKISDIKTKSKDNDKGSRSKITKHEGTSLQRIQRPRPQDLNDKSNLIDLMKECHNELTSGEIVSYAFELVVIGCGLGEDLLRIQKSHTCFFLRQRGRMNPIALLWNNVLRKLLVYSLKQGSAGVLSTSDFSFQGLLNKAFPVVGPHSTFTVDVDMSFQIPDGVILPLKLIF
ncbi:hypothetical protein Tco_0860156 [Tanacetum coccineum]|uniref:Uncharacterized protein n=1 Tax=Tanacetum coccineum TaxID=301880 RepID=A0ABQ5BFV9_9ASTR